MFDFMFEEIPFWEFVIGGFFIGGCMFAAGLICNFTVELVIKLLGKIFKDTRLKPKDVIFYRNELGSLDCYCPCCGSSLSDFVQDNYCRECGQAIKWPQIVEENEHS